MKASQDLGVKQVRVLHDSEILTPAVQATTNSYADVTGSILDARFLSSVAFVIQNSHVANDLDYKILGSIDGVTYVEVQGETTVQESANSSYSATVAVWGYYKVQVKSTAPGAAASALVHAIAK